MPYGTREPWNPCPLQFLMHYLLSSLLPVTRCGSGEILDPCQPALLLQLVSCSTSLQVHLHTYCLIWSSHVELNHAVTVIGPFCLSFLTWWARFFLRLLMALSLLSGRRFLGVWCLTIWLMIARNWGTRRWRRPRADCAPVCTWLGKQVEGTVASTHAVWLLPPQTFQIVVIHVQRMENAGLIFIQSGESGGCETMWIQGDEWLIEDFRGYHRHKQEAYWHPGSLHKTMRNNACRIVSVLNGK